MVGVCGQAGDRLSYVAFACGDKSISRREDAQIPPFDVRHVWRSQTTEPPDMLGDEYEAEAMTPCPNKLLGGGPPTATFRTNNRRQQVLVIA